MSKKRNRKRIKKPFNPQKKVEAKTQEPKKPEIKPPSNEGFERIFLKYSNVQHNGEKLAYIEMKTTSSIFDRDTASRKCEEEGRTPESYETHEIAQMCSLPYGVIAQIDRRDFGGFQEVYLKALGLTTALLDLA